MTLYYSLIDCIILIVSSCIATSLFNKLTYSLTYLLRWRRLHNCDVKVVGQNERGTTGLNLACRRLLQKCRWTAGAILFIWKYARWNIYVSARLTSVGANEARLCAVSNGVTRVLSSLGQKQSSEASNSKVAGTAVCYQPHRYGNSRANTCKGGAENAWPDNDGPNVRYLIFLVPHFRVLYFQSRFLAGRLPLLSDRPAVTLATPKRAATNFAAWWTEAQWVWTVCLRLLPDSVATAIWTRALLRLSQHANHSATKRKISAVTTAVNKISNVVEYFGEAVPLVSRLVFMRQSFVAWIRAVVASRNSKCVIGLKPIAECMSTLCWEDCQPNSLPNSHQSAYCKHQSTETALSYIHDHLIYV